MNTSGEAADQIVRMSLNGVEVAAKITGAGAKQLAVMLYAIMKDQKRTNGKIRLQSMLRSGKELKVFAVKKEDLQKFTTEAKRYGVLYCVLRDKNGNDGISDVMVRAEDASKINRIFERFKLATVDTASIKSNIEKSKQSKDSEKQSNERDMPQKDNNDKFLNELMEKPIQKEQAQNQNPTTAQTTKPPQSEPISKNKDKSEKGTFEPERERPSVRKELNDIKAEKAKAHSNKKDESQQQKTNTHIASPSNKSKYKKSKEK
jgi:hypothetical protein